MTDRMSGYWEPKPYVCMFEAARLHLANAERTEDDEFFNAMSCLLMSALMLEAYVNHAGWKYVEKWPSQKEEREKKLNTKKKLKALLKHKNTRRNWSVRPYMTFNTLFRFRDAAVHARTVRIQFRGHRLTNSELRSVERQLHWERLGTPECARVCFEDAVAIVRDVSTLLDPVIDPFFSSGHGFYGVNDSKDSRA